MTLSKTALFNLTTTLLLLAGQAFAAVHDVREGDSIQAAVEAAQPGDTILVHPGIYRETVYVDKDDITLRGVVVEGEWPNLEGDKQLNDAILYSGNGFTVEWFKITHYKGNAIMGQAGNNFSIRNNWIVDTGVYGIFPEFGENGLIENNVLSGIEDAAIYVGMCDYIDVRNNRVFENVAGIEIENSRHALVEGNIAHDNTGGILVFITPGLPIKTSYDAIVRRNTVINNNTPNFAIPGSLVSTIPAGTGIIVNSGDDVVIEDNIITGNNTAGIIVTSQDFATGVAGDPASDPNPDRVQILDNVMFNNGSDPATEVKALMLTQFSTTGPDILAYKGAAEAERERAGTWRFSVTVSHPDTGWEHYADRWEVVAPDGRVLGTRVLLHPHVEEQPFTRSLGGVTVPGDLSEVIVRAHCSVDGDGGQSVTVTLAP